MTFDLDMKSAGQAPSCCSLAKTPFSEIRATIGTLMKLKILYTHTHPENKNQECLGSWHSVDTVDFDPFNQHSLVVSPLEQHRAIDLPTSIHSLPAYKKIGLFCNTFGIFT